jgi:hypothetical protein
MGLDQYAMANGEDFFTWRNCGDIQGFMEDLYFERGGEGDSEGLFNNEEVVLTLEDIDALEAQEWFDDPEFCSAARWEFEHGAVVVYRSWW